MRRLGIVVALLVVGIGWLPAAATADGETETALDVRILGSDLYYPGSGKVVTAHTADLRVSGRGCVPQEAPASVIVTIDRLADRTLSTKPDRRGRWRVNTTIPYPPHGTYLVNAECDNYYGVTQYRQAEAGPDDVVVLHVHVDAIMSNPIAETGARTIIELTAGIALVSLGLLFVWSGRSRSVRAEQEDAPCVG